MRVVQHHKSRCDLLRKLRLFLLLWGPLPERAASVCALPLLRKRVAPYHHGNHSSRDIPESEAALRLGARLRTVMRRFHRTFLFGWIAASRLATQKGGPSRSSEPARPARSLAGRARGKPATHRRGLHIVSRKRPAKLIPIDTGRRQLELFDPGDAAFDGTDPKVESTFRKRKSFLRGTE
jgi:hypothetical protein